MIRKYNSDKIEEMAAAGAVVIVICYSGNHFCAECGDSVDAADIEGIVDGKSDSKYAGLVCQNCGVVLIEPVAFTAEMEAHVRDELERIIYTVKNYDGDETTRQGLVDLVRSMVEGTWEFEELDRKWYLGFDDEKVDATDKEKQDRRWHELNNLPYEEKKEEPVENQYDGMPVQTGDQIRNGAVVLLAKEVTGGEGTRDGQIILCVLPKHEFVIWWRAVDGDMYHGDYFMPDEELPDRTEVLRRAIAAWEERS